MLNQKLLIIDDSIDVHELVQIWLEGEPVEFLSVYSGEDGLDTAGRTQPDLILLDVDLPGMNGFEVCRRLKTAVATADIPVVFLTGAASTDEKLQGLELGAIDYITKPFDPAELRARVRAALNTRRLMELLAQKAINLQESEERFRILAENSSDVISRHTPAGIFLYASPACLAIFGYKPEEIQGRSLLEFIHPQDLDAMKIGWAKQQAPGETRAFSFRLLRSNGRYVWIESTFRTLADASTGQIREIHAAARDITVRKQMEYREQIRVDVLEMVTQGNPLNDILRRLITAVEDQDAKAIAAGIMLSGRLVHHCAPSLPPKLSFSIESQLYRLISRFGTLALENNERIIISNLTDDPAWQELGPAFTELGLSVAGLSSSFPGIVMRPARSVSIAATTNDLIHPW